MLIAILHNKLAAWSLTILVGFSRLKHNEQLFSASTHTRA